MPARPTRLSILIIDENRLRASVIEAGLREAGYDNLTLIHDVSGIARRIADVEPDVIFIDLENPNRDMLENMFQLSRAVKRPIAMFVDRSDQAAIEAAVDAGVSAYVVDGLKRERVKPILDMAISRFNAFSRMTRELEEARSELENRKLIDRAKGILMATRGPERGGCLRAAAQDGDEPEPQDLRDCREPDHGGRPSRSAGGQSEDDRRTSDHRRLHAAARQRHPRGGQGEGLRRAEGIDLVSRARDVVGQHPRPHGGRPFPGRAHARADADRVQPWADAARRAGHRAHGARPRRQCGDGVDGALGRA